METKELNEKIVEALSKKTIYLYKKEFFGWLLSDSQDWSNVVDDLISSETIHLKDYLEIVGYIPIEYVKNKEDLTSEEIKEGEITDPENYNLEIVR